MKKITPLILLSGFITYFMSSCGYKVPDEKIKVDLTDINKEIIVSSVADTSEVEICTTQKVKWKPGSDESILLDPQSDVIYPGSVIDPSSIQNGKYKEVKGDRKPVTISISVLSKDTLDATVEQPTNSSIRKAISKIINSKSKGKNPAQMTLNCNEIYSRDHLNLLLKGSYSAGFGKVESAFNFSNENMKTRYLLDLTQIYYSIDVDALGPKDFFNKKPETPLSLSPTYVSSVKYGRRVMIIIETNRNIQNKSFELLSEFKLFAGSGSFSANSASQKLFDEKSINLLVMGGNPERPFELFKAISTKDSLYNLLKADAIWTSENEGVPLAYTLRNCSDGSIFSVIQSGDYVARKCSIKPAKEITLEVGDIAKLCALPDGGGDREFNGHGPKVNFSFELFTEGNKIYAKTECRWRETQDNWTSCSFFENKREIATVPDSLVLIEITSGKKSSLIDKVLNGHGEHPFDKNEFVEPDGPIRNLSLIGDTDDDDDPWVGDCGDKHTQIKRISLYPIKVSVRKRR